MSSNMFPFAMKLRVWLFCSTITFAREDVRGVSLTLPCPCTSCWTRYRRRACSEIWQIQMVITPLPVRFLSIIIMSRIKWYPNLMLIWNNTWYHFFQDQALCNVHFWKQKYITHCARTVRFYLDGTPMYFIWMKHQCILFGIFSY